MSAFNNKKKPSGLRILWIPGRKKHGRKGRVETTKNRVDYSGKQKQIEPWSLGGSKGQEGLIRADISGQSEGPSISSILPASCAIAANVPLQSNMKLEEETNKFATLDVLNEEVNHEQKHEQNEYHQIEKHNSTLPLNDKRDARQQQIQDDVNSIELIGEKCLSEDKFDIDRPDGSLNNITKKNNHKKKNKKKKKKNKSDDEYQTQEEEDKVVTCLYYTLMCCECSIS